jgi:hypothetical protein
MVSEPFQPFGAGGERTVCWLAATKVMAAARASVKSDIWIKRDIPMV